MAFLQLVQHKPINLLLSTYWTMGAVRHGDYVANLKGGGSVVRASGQISFKEYQKAEAQLVLPKLASERVTLDLHGGRRNYPGINLLWTRT